VVLALMIQPGAASAQSDEERAAARSLWSQASEAMSAGKFEETIDLATRAEALVHAPTHLLLIARAQAKLGRFVAARESYLKITREELPATAPGAFKNAQQEAKSELPAIEPKIASLKVVVEGASGRKIPVKIDDQPVAEALVGVHRPIDPGKHNVVAYPPSLSPVEQSVTLGDGEKKEIKLVIPAGPLPSGTPGSAADDPDGQSGQGQQATLPPDTGGAANGLTYAGIGVTGLAVAGIAVGIVFTAMASGTLGDADDAFAACTPNCTPAQRDNITKFDSDAATQGTIGTIGFIAGGAAFAAGLPLLIVGLTRKPHPQKTGWVAPYVAPNGFGAFGRF
jgi:hypothetical protein